MGYTSTPESSSCCIMCLAHTFMTVFFNNKNYGKLSPSPPYRCTMPRWKLLQAPTTIRWFEGWWHQLLPETACSLRLKFFFLTLQVLIWRPGSSQRDFPGYIPDLHCIVQWWPIPKVPRLCIPSSTPCLEIQNEPKEPQDKWSGKLHKSLHYVDLLSALNCLLLGSSQTLLFKKVTRITFNRIMKWLLVFLKQSQ